MATRLVKVTLAFDPERLPQAGDKLLARDSNGNSMRITVKQVLPVPGEDRTWRITGQTHHEENCELKVCHHKEADVSQANCLIF